MSHVMGVSELLETVDRRLRVLEEAEERIKDRLAPRFRIFDYLRTDEHAVSRCIADLLDPKGNHGQGSIFLKKFLELDDALNWFTCKDDSIEVATEKLTNKGRRIDIWIRSSAGVIGIENKPWAGDQDKQLEHYAEFLEEIAGNSKWCLVFLSERHPSELSITKEKLQRLRKDRKLVEISFGQVQTWLEACTRWSKAESVTVFVEEFAKFVRTKINGDLDMTEQSEVVNAVMASPKRLEAAFAIQKSWQAITAKLMEEFYEKLSKKMKETFSGKYPHLKCLESKFVNGATEGGFSFDLCEDADFCLRFAFANKDYGGFYWTICHAEGTGDDGDKNRIKIHQIMNEEFPNARGRTTPWSAWWTWARYTDELVECKLSDWETSPEPWMAIREDSRHLDSIVNIVKRVYEAFSDKMYLLAHKAD